MSNAIMFYFTARDFLDDVFATSDNNVTARDVLQGQE